MGRAHKTHGGPAVGQLVAHHFGDGKLGYAFVQGLLQAFGQGGAFDRAVVEKRFGFAVRCALQAVHRRCVGAQGLQFFQQSGGGCTADIQAHGDRHELLRHRFVSGLGADSRQVRSQATGRSKRGQHRAGIRQALDL